MLRIVGQSGRTPKYYKRMSSGIALYVPLQKALEIVNKSLSQKVDKYNAELKDLKSLSFEAQLCTDQDKQYLMMQVKGLKCF